MHRIHTSIVEKLSEKLGDPDWFRARRFEAAKRKPPSHPTESFPEFPHSDTPTQMPQFDPLPLSESIRKAFIPVGIDLFPLHEIPDAKEMQALIQPLVFSQFLNDENGFAAAHMAHVNETLVVRIRPDVQTDGPLLLDIPLGASARISYILLIAQENSKASVVLQISGGAQQNHCLGIEAVAETGASLSVDFMTDLGKQTNLISFSRVSVGKDASVQWCEGLLGSSRTQTSTNIRLLQEGAHANLRTAFLGDQKTNMDFSGTIFHEAPSTTSDMTIRGVLRDSSRASHDGLIRIHPSASNTKAHQQTHTLLLSPDAHMKPTPKLEVENHQVQCGHGATTGRINTDQLFYAMSRGLSRNAAICEIASGHLLPILDDVTDPDVKEWLKGRISKRLSRSVVQHS